MHLNLGQEPKEVKIARDRLNHQKMLIGFEREKEEALVQILSEEPVCNLEILGLCINNLVVIGCQRKRRISYIKFAPKWFKDLSFRERKQVYSNSRFTDRFSQKNIDRHEMVLLYTKYVNGGVVGTSRAFLEPKKERLRGFVKYIDDFTITIQTNKYLDPNDSTLYLVALSASLLPFKVYQETFDKIEKIIGNFGDSHSDMVRKILNAKAPNFDPNDKKNGFRERNVKLMSEYKKLNKWQNHTFAKAWDNRVDYSVLFGPPGTGKSHVLTLIAREAVKKRKKVLITGFSNASVNNLLRNLKEYANNNISNLSNYDDGINLVRVGSLVKTDDDLVHFHIKEIVAMYETKIEKKIREKFNEENSGREPNAEEEKEIKAEVKIESDKYGMRVLKKADIIFATQVSIYSDFLMKGFMKSSSKRLEVLDDFESNTKVFDLALIDEAGQSIEISTWLPIIHSKKFIIAGDPKQLTPVVKNSHKAIELEKSLLVKLAEMNNHLNTPWLTKLKFNYRSNQKIVDKYSDWIYDGYVESAEKNSKQNLRDIIGRQRMIDPRFDFIREHIKQDGCLWIDTSGERNYFREIKTSTSVPSEQYNFLKKHLTINKGEADVIGKIFILLVKCFGINPDKIGIIATYKAQANLIFNQLMKLTDDFDISEICDVSTVDAFQGREKEIIIISMVRSNYVPKRAPKHARIGFLVKDERINVAFSRPKKLMIVIGDCSTMSASDFVNNTFLRFQYDNAVMDPGIIYQCFRNLQTEFFYSQ